jgi:hypothetical protein
MRTITRLVDDHVWLIGWVLAGIVGTVIAKALEAS